MLLIVLYGHVSPKAGLLVALTSANYAIAFTLFEVH